MRHVNNSNKFNTMLDSLGFVLVDIGSRGGFDEDLAEISWCTKAVGFEPNPEAFAQLIPGAPGKWRAEKHIPFAIGGENGPANLYLPESHQGASLLPHNSEIISKFGFQNLHLDIRAIPISTRTLDSLFQDGDLDRADYLKIDIEGAELEVLKSAEEFLKTCSAIKVECSFLEQRVKQPLAWDVAKYLLSKGYEIVELHDIHRWRRRPSLYSHPYLSNFEMPYSRGQISQVDLIAIKEPDKCASNEFKLRYICLISALGYFDSAINFMRENAEMVDYALTEYGVHLEAELNSWSAKIGAKKSVFAIKDAFKTLIRHIRSKVFGMPAPVFQIPY